MVVAVEPPYSHDAGPAAVKPSILRMVSSEIEWYYQRNGGTPAPSEEDEDFWILGMAPEDVPPVYQLPKPYAVYYLRCEQVSPETIRERADHFDLDVSEEFVNAYYFGGPPRYVGYTENPYRRLDEHFDPFARGAKFTKLIPPKELVCIEWHETEDEAKEAEQRIADKERTTQGAFINPSLLDGTPPTPVDQ